MLLRALRVLKLGHFRGPHRIKLLEWYLNTTRELFRTPAFTAGNYFWCEALGEHYLTVEMLQRGDPRAKGKDNVALYTFNLWVDAANRPLQVRPSWRVHFSVLLQAPLAQTLHSTTATMDAGNLAKLC